MICLHQCFDSQTAIWSPQLCRGSSGHLLKRKENKRQEKKRKEKTMPFGVNLLRSPVLYRASVVLLQDNTLAVAACSAFSQMAFIAPDLVLPLVQTRFQVRCQSDINPTCVVHTHRHESVGHMVRAAGPHHMLTALAVLIYIILLLHASANQAVESWLAESNNTACSM